MKNKLEKINLGKRYENYKLKDDRLITYKNIMYISNYLYFRRIVVEVHKIPYSKHPSYMKTISTIRKQTFFWNEEICC